MMKDKAKALKLFEHFVNMIKPQFGIQVNKIRFDNTLEYVYGSLKRIELWRGNIDIYLK